MKNSFSDKEIIILAVYLLGGNTNPIDTEDIAVKSNELASGRFTWFKYPHQINIEKIRKSLSDAKKQKNGGYVLGLHKDGWLLTETGLNFSKKRINDLEHVNISRPPINKKEIAYYNREKIRMISTKAYEKISNNNADAVTIPEAEAFFRIDDYVKGEIRRQKIERIITTFNDDPDLSSVIQILAERVRKNDR